MTVRMGVSLDATSARAVVVRRGRVGWAAEATYANPSDLTDVLGRLAAERPRSARAVAVALEPDVAQCRRVDGFPLLSRRELAQHVALYSRRFFLRNGEALVTDAAPLRAKRNERCRSAIVAAVDESIVNALVDGLRAAGLRVVEIAPSALWTGANERSAHTFAGSTTNEEAFETACAAACGSTPALSLLPPALRHRAERVERASLLRWAAACALAQVLAAASFIAATSRNGSDADREIARLKVPMARALAVRRDLDATTEALRFLESGAASRTSTARLLAAIATALPDSAFITSLRLDDRGEGSVTGWAARASAVPARLERVAGIRRAALDGSISREVVAGIERERFTVNLRLGDRE